MTHLKEAVIIFT